MASARFRAKHFVLGTVGALIAAIIATSITSVHLLREREVESWRAQLSNLSLVMAEQTYQTMSSSQIAMHTIAERIDLMHIQNDTEFRTRTNTPEIFQMLRDTLAGLPQLDVATLVAANGDVINFTRSFPAPKINLADRDYYQAHLNNPSLGLFVSIPVKNKGNGKWVFYLSHRLNDPHGKFVGLVLVGISVDQITDFYQHLAENLGPGAAITLYRRDFSILTRWPRKDETIGQKNLTGTSHLVVEEMKKSEAVIYSDGPRFSAAGSPVARLGAVRVLERFPLIINLTVTEDFFLANWRHATRLIAAVATGSTLALILAAIFLLRIARQREQSTTLLSELTDQVPGILFQFQMKPDGKTSFPYVNQRFIDFYGLTKEQLSGEGSSIFAYQHPDDTDRIRCSISESARTLQPWHEEYRLVIPGKGIVWRRGDAQPQKLRDGTILWHGYIADITDRKLMEATLQQQLIFSNAINEISSVLVEQENPETILAKTVHIVGNVLGADRALIYDVSFTQQQVTGLSQWKNPALPGIYPDKPVYPLSAFSGGAAELQRTKSWFTSQYDNINPHLQADGSGELLHGKMNILSLLWYPLAFQKNGFYALVLNHINQRKEWSKEEIGFIDSVSRLVSVELEKIRLIEQNKKAESDLRIAATAFESQEGMLISDAENIILQVNQAFTSITGYNNEDVVGKNPSILSSGRQDKKFYTAMWKAIKLDGTWEGEVWNQRKNGEEYPEHLTITAVKDSHGQVTNYVGALTDITRNKAADEEIKNLAFYDPLTGLPNRRLLQDRLQQALASSSRNGHEGALLFIDLDNFKTLNDTLGHDVGDILLQQVAIRLATCVREGDTVARLGGDEFVVMLEGLSQLPLEAAEQTELIGVKILAKLNEPYLLKSHQHHSTPSIGATLFLDHHQPMENLLKQADIAMYQAKKSGRNTLRFFDPIMQETISARSTLESELRRAIDSEQFQLHYQVQVNSAGHPTGAEALIRWIHAERGTIAPNNFIPLTEETGLILPLGLWVLDTACAQIKIWQSNPLTRELILAVNVSSRQFRQPEFVSQIKATVHRHAINPKLLKFELTESLLLENIEDTIAKMNALKEIGVRFSLDDFGTGYSSLQYLKRLPLDQLKIDQSFVSDIATDSSDKTIVSTIIAMAHSLNLDVIAEGVESMEQRQFLLNEGCTNFQGYLFSPPLPVAAFEAFLRTGSTLTP